MEVFKRKNKAYSRMAGFSLILILVALDDLFHLLFLAVIIYRLLLSVTWHQRISPIICLQPLAVLSHPRRSQPCLAVPGVICITQDHG